MIVVLRTQVLQIPVRLHGILAVLHRALQILVPLGVRLIRVPVLPGTKCKN